MSTSRVTCSYCFEPRDSSKNIHGCPQSLAGQERVKEIIGNIRTMHQPSSSVSLVRLRRRREIAQNIKVIGGGVKPQN